MCWPGSIKCTSYESLKYYANSYQLGNGFGSIVKTTCVLVTTGSNFYYSRNDFVTNVGIYDYRCSWVVLWNAKKIIALFIIA
jgi:hypothetical protein